VCRLAGGNTQVTKTNAEILNLTVEQTKPGLALDELKTWLHKPLRAYGKKRRRPSIAAEPDDPILELGLPPRGRYTIPKKFAVLLLRAGAEIEHSLLVEYLYAAYSIDERRGDVEKNIALNWKTDIRLIAREEMAHLITVQNLLLALGADFHFDRTSFHRNQGHLPIPFKLEPLSLKSLAKYIILESPSQDQINPLDQQLVRRIHDSLGERSRIRRVGSIYAALYWLFMESDTPDGDWPFSPKTDRYFLETYHKDFHLSNKDFSTTAFYRKRAALPQEWGVFESNMHVDDGSLRQNALASLRWIMSQGEGPNAIEDSHFYRFLGIYKQMVELRAGNRPFIMRAATNPLVRDGNHKAGSKEMGTPVANPRSKQWAKLLNVRYHLMLLNILDSLNESRVSEPEKRRLYAQLAVVEMEFVKKIGQALPRMSLKKKGNYERAGAPFQTTLLPPNRAKRQSVKRQLLDDSERIIASLGGEKRSTTDLPTFAIEESLLDAVAQHDDKLRRMN
jgi:Ferritin-like